MSIITCAAYSNGESLPVPPEKALGLVTHLRLALYEMMKRFHDSGSNFSVFHSATSDRLCATPVEALSAIEQHRDIHVGDHTDPLHLAFLSRLLKFNFLLMHHFHVLFDLT